MQQVAPTRIAVAPRDKTAAVIEKTRRRIDPWTWGVPVVVLAVLGIVATWVVCAIALVTGIAALVGAYQ